MDFLSKSAAQLNDLFRSMSPGARITSALLLAVVVASLVFLARFDSSSPDDYLMGGHVFSGRDLTAALGALSAAKLGNFEVEGSHIRVPRGQQHTYIAALLDGRAMPRHSGSWFEELKQTASPFESQRQQNVRLDLARQDELAQTIGAMRGIELATVQFGEATRKNGIGRQTERTAAIGVLPVASSELGSGQIKSIREFVAVAIGGKPSNVLVMDLDSGYSFAGVAEDGTPTASNDPYFQRQREHEQKWKNDIKELLGYIHGVKVGVKVVLDTDLHHEQNSVKFDPQVIALKSQSSLISEKIMGRGPAGRPGVVPNTATSNLQAAVVQGQASDTDKTEETESQESLASYDQTVTKKTSLPPKKVTASIVVPRSHFRKVWESRNGPANGQPPPAPSAADLATIETKLTQDIQETVVHLLPAPPAGDDKYPLVTVTVFDDKTAGPLPEPGTVENASSWLAQNWTTLGMLGVALVGLLMLRSFVRSGPPAPAPDVDVRAALSVLHPEEQPEEEGEEVGPVKRQRRVLKSGANPREELTEMVNDNPEAAAAILRSWIGEAG